MTAPWQSRNFELVPDVSLGDIVDLLNKPDSDFGYHLNPAEWTAAPEIKVLGEGLGYLAYVYSIRFHTPDGVRDVVAKVPTEKLNYAPTISEEKRLEAVTAMLQLHTNELQFYRLFRKYGYGDLKLVKFFGGREWTLQQPGVLLMEDASNKNCKRPFTGIFTFEDFQVREVIVEVAKIQAIGFRFSKEESSQLGIGAAMMTEMFELVHTFIDDVTSKGLPFLTPQRVKHMREMCNEKTFRKLTEACLDENLPLVLAHDDLWPQNMFVDAEGHIQGVFDWQYSRFASCTQDLALMLALTLPGEVRRAREDEYLQFYLDQLKLQLDRFQITDAGGMESLTLDVVRRLYRESLKWAQAVVIFSVGQFDDKNPGVNGGEPPLQNRFRCCLEDVWPE